MKKIKKKNEATNVASPRSRSGQAEEDKIKEQLRGAKSKIIISTDKDANVFSDFAKYLEQQLNELLEKEIKKKIN